MEILDALRDFRNALAVDVNTCQMREIQNFSWKLEEYLTIKPVG